MTKDASIRLRAYLEEARRLPWSRIRAQVLRHGEATLGRRDRLAWGREDPESWLLALVGVVCEQGFYPTYRPDPAGSEWLVVSLYPRDYAAGG